MGDWIMGGTGTGMQTDRMGDGSKDQVRTIKQQNKYKLASG